jgi:hypothetical protein
MSKKETHFQERRVQRMEAIDQLPPNLKAVVHDWGWYIVKSFMDCGVTKPKHMRHLIEVVLDDTRAPRGISSSSQK